MAFDIKVLKKVRQVYEQKKLENEQRNAILKNEIYKKHTDLHEIDKQLKLIAIEMLKATIEKNLSKISELRKKTEVLKQKRQAILLQNGYKTNELDFKYICDICKDEGYIGAKPCNCFTELYKKEQVRELSNTLNMNEHTFEDFKLDYYSNDDTLKIGISPKKNMEMIYTFSKQYAEGFGASPQNILFSGDVGLGKTFMSTAIAKRVCEKGYSVVYSPACNIFSSFDENRFGKSADEASPDEIKRYFASDLLIIDDLGTEPVTSYSISCLYNLINTRLIRKKSTIINTNLKKDEINRKYSPQIISRIEGEYTHLLFFGEDIRKLKSK